MLIEEKLKFEEIMKEFFEEESKREEEEDSDSDSDSDENKNNNIDNTNEQKSHSTARSRRHSSQFDLQEEEKVPVRSTRLVDVKNVLRLYSFFVLDGIHR